MREIKIDLLAVQPLSQTPSSTPPKAVKKGFPKMLIMVLSVLFLLSSTAVFSYQRSLDEDSQLNKTLQIFSGIGHFVVNADRALDGEKNDRINIALLGIGGEQHEGGQLTDTILIASIQPSTKKVAMMSIPRDLLVNIEGYGWRKINNANAFGELNEPGKGAELARKTISELIGQPINYYVKVDFQAFQEIVDTVGGVNVIVDNNFTDYQYPTYDKKYQVVSFESGPQLMDGSTALKYVRSRHSGMNNEGSDFARSKRQQKVIMALRDKLLSTDTLLNPKKITDILNSLQSHISTDMEVWEMLKLATIAKDVNTSSISNLVLDDGPGGYLYSGMVEGAYVLQVRDGNAAIQEAFSHLLEAPSTADSTSPRLNAAPTAIKAKVAVQNGTLIEGFASRSAQRLKYDGYDVVSISNALERDLLQTVIYDLSGGVHSTEIEEIKTKFNATVSTQPYIDPTGSTPTDADFLIILGDATNQ